MLKYSGTYIYDESNENGFSLNNFINRPTKRSKPNHLPFIASSSLNSSSIQSSQISANPLSCYADSLECQLVEMDSFTNSNGNQINQIVNNQSDTDDNERIIYLVCQVRNMSKQLMSLQENLASVEKELLKLKKNRSKRLS